MTVNACALIRVLREPRCIASLDGTGWDTLIRQARSADLLGTLRCLLDDEGLLAAVPDAPRVHLESGYLTAQKQVRDVHYEVKCICATLARSRVRLILLKGAAYVMAGLPVARGRVFGDVDILVPGDAVERVEKDLRADLWMPASDDAYDQHYYRTWMHQIPPLIHAGRESVIDVHHSIVARTARFDVQVQALHDGARPVAGYPGLAVLAPPHLVVHSAAHLFNEGEFEHGLRDLVDLDGLLRDFGRDPDFWPALVHAARELDLTRPLHYALRYASRLLATPVPGHVRAESRAWRPRGLLGPLMDALFMRVLVPDHPTCAPAGAAAARFALYVRAHYLRMPLTLLLPHLARKAWRRVFRRGD